MMKKHSIQQFETLPTFAALSLGKWCASVLAVFSATAVSRRRASARLLCWCLTVFLPCLLPSFSFAMPSQSELASLKRDTMALFADRAPSQAMPEKRQVRASRASDRAMAAGWRQALAKQRFDQQGNVFEQQRGYANSDRRMLNRAYKRPMVILPPDVDIDVALLTMHNNPSFEGATVVLMKVPFLRDLTALQRAYGHLDIRIVESSAIRKELKWVDLPILVTETGQITRFHF